MEYVYILLVIIGWTNSPVELATFGSEDACRKVAVELSKTKQFGAINGEEKVSKPSQFGYICLKAPDGVE